MGADELTRVNRGGILRAGLCRFGATSKYASDGLGGTKTPRVGKRGVVAATAYNGRGGGVGFAR